MYCSKFILSVCLFFRFALHFGTRVKYFLGYFSLYCILIQVNHYAFHLVVSWVLHV